LLFFIFAFASVVIFGAKKRGQKMSIAAAAGRTMNIVKGKGKGENKQTNKLQNRLQLAHHHQNPP
jgi:hypothetical protein